MRIVNLIVCSALVTVTSYVYAEEGSQEPEKTPVVKKEVTAAERGKQLHTEKCVSCHTTEVYTRKERKVTHYEGLQSRVETCAVNLDLSWFDNDINDVVTYLNTDYYHFAKETKTQETSQDNLK